MSQLRPNGKMGTESRRRDGHQDRIGTDIVKHAKPPACLIFNATLYIFVRE
jgi:hypothetical protein